MAGPLSLCRSPVDTRGAWQGAAALEEAPWPQDTPAELLAGKQTEQESGAHASRYPDLCAGPVSGK